MKNESSLTLKFRGVESEILNEMVESGLFATKSEAIRAALVKYAMDVGMFSRGELWGAIDSFPKRKVTAAQLEKDLKRL